MKNVAANKVTTKNTVPPSTAPSRVEVRASEPPASSQPAKWQEGSAEDQLLEAVSDFMNDYAFVDDALLFMASSGVGEGEEKIFLNTLYCIAQRLDGLVKRLDDPRLRAHAEKRGWAAKAVA